ncbi:MAG: hypothetical protein EA376_13155 [Phycisphaeraceae bacterium]|nr:MAG: hypothetical protein EA376_13155 [Phycisphaeraceae bacterium]
MRVLHLIDPATGGWMALEALGALLREEHPGAAHRCVLIGSADDARAARRLGVPSHDRIHPPLRSARFAAPALRRLLRRRPAPDTLHAWSMETLSLAAAAMPTAPRRVTLCAPPQCASPSFAKAAMAPALLRRRGERRPSNIAFLSEHLRRQWAQAGLGAAAERGEIISTPPYAAGAPLPDRTALRAAWGMTDSDFIIALLGEPASALDVRRLIMSIGPLSVSGRRVACAAPIEARGMERSRRFIERLGNHLPLAPCSPLPWRTLPGVDAAVWLGADAPAGAGSTMAPGARSIEWACALGVPVVAEDFPDSREAAASAAKSVDIPVRFTPAGRPLEIARALLSITNQRRSHLAARS